MALLHSYRRRDPLYPRLLAVGYRRLAGRALERVRRLIGYISAKIAGCDTRNVYSTIKTIEDILRFFPREQYEAISGMDRMYRYAQVLNFQVKPMEQAAEMVRSYLSRSLPVLETERRRRQQAQIRKEKPPALIDFSAVVFSREDLERIEIPPHLSRFEDQTLAYCAKYWNLVNDVSFEQILFLYSRKYRTKNHTVYMAIRQGRGAGRRDEEILSSVMSLLVTGYYYSIQGDRELQRRWQEIRFGMDRAVTAAKNAASARPAPVKSAPVKPEPAGPVPVKSAPAKPAPAGPEPPPEPEAPAREAPIGPAPARPPARKAVPAEKKRPAGKAALPAAGPAPPAKPVPAVVQRPAAEQRPAAPAVPPAEGSVSDRLRKLSGRSYDLYQDRFLAQARPAIRKILGLGRGLFFTLPEKVEDLVYYYLRDHYADPYMNWAESAEFRQLMEQGFRLPSLDPVIDECFRRIK
jgi:hypothetical protein